MLGSHRWNCKILRSIEGRLFPFTNTYFGHKNPHAEAIRKQKQAERDWRPDGVLGMAATKEINDKMEAQHKLDPNRPNQFYLGEYAHLANKPKPNIIPIYLIYLIYTEILSLYIANLYKLNTKPQDIGLDQ